MISGVSTATEQHRIYLGAGGLSWLIYSIDVFLWWEDTEEEKGEVIPISLSITSAWPLAFFRATEQHGLIAWAQAAVVDILNIGGKCVDRTSPKKRGVSMQVFQLNITHLRLSLRCD